MCVSISKVRLFRKGVPSESKLDDASSETRRNLKEESWRPEREKTIDQKTIDRIEAMQKKAEEKEEKRETPVIKMSL